MRDSVLSLCWYWPRDNISKIISFFFQLIFHVNIITNFKIASPLLRAQKQLIDKEACSLADYWSPPHVRLMLRHSVIIKETAFLEATRGKNMLRWKHLFSLWLWTCRLQLSHHLLEGDFTNWISSLRFPLLLLRLKQHPVSKETPETGCTGLICSPQADLVVT